ncbi:transposase [Parabacteroides massiliensis]|uniref:transposase n=1 Tax=Parabacteroides massiliensis TaxID=1750560 RepID=UPI00373FCF0A
MSLVPTISLTVLTTTSRCCIELSDRCLFVVRAKKNLQYKPIKWKRRMPKNVLSDMAIGVTGFYPKQYYPEPLRLVRYWDEEQNREFVFLTNATHISPLQVAELYKNRCNN